MASELRTLAAAPDLLLAGTVVDGQFAIERVLGAGAMGVVYLARDQRLERPVALKVARQPASLAAASREAVALAKLSHPNVVVVHQVGELGGRVYVAMEYVPGPTARAWCDSQDARACIALYAAAGDGLAAAHAAGLVHRDVKPDNVLVGEDGRPRVADFGLAREARAVTGGREGGAAAVTGVAGTPAYMAPEQLGASGTVDARADQFALCASLWEALHGALPFVGATPAARREAIERGELVRAIDERARAIPRHVDAALRRGLAADPAERWPSLAALVAELRRDPDRRRRQVRLGTLAGGALVGGTIALVAVLHSPADAAQDPCAGGEARVATVWSPARGEALRGQFADSTAGWTARAAERAVRASDAWAARWTEEYRTVCRTTAWSPGLRDAGMACLSRALHGLDDTMSALGVDAASTDAQLAHLPDPALCEDPAYLDATAPPPADPELRDAVEARRIVFDRIEALRIAGRTADAKRQLDDLGVLPPLAYAPITSFEHMLRADFGESSPLATAEETYVADRRAGDRVDATHAAFVAAEALLDAANTREATHWATLAMIEAEGLPDVKLRANAFRIAAEAATAADQPEQGLAYAQSAVAAARACGDVYVERNARQERAHAYDRLGNFDAELADLRAVADGLERDYGEHPQLASALADMALAYDHMDRRADAIAAARHALTVAEHTLGADSEATNAAVTTLATTLGHAQEFPEALALFDRALATDRRISAERGESPSYNTAVDLANRCDLLRIAGRYAAALADCRIAVADLRTIEGADGAEVAPNEMDLAFVLYDDHRFAEARATLATVLPVTAKHPDSRAHAEAMLIAGASDAVLGNRAAAQRELAAALAVFGKPDESPELLGWTHLELARIATDPVAARQHAALARPLLAHDPGRLRQLDAICASVRCAK
jgi:tetratricopeptide (TPR) repeat protein/predicted Ser/Thr protein kinase